MHHLNVRERYTRLVGRLFTADCLQALTYGKGCTRTSLVSVFFAVRDPDLAFSSDAMPIPLNFYS